MKTSVLISCVSKKLATRAPAAQLYTSQLFRGNLQYARSLHPDAIYILSAKYGLVALDEPLEPYNQTLNNMGVAARKAWAARVVSQLRSVADPQHDRFIFLAGIRYREYLLPHIPHHEIPLEGLGLGEQLHALKELTHHD